MPTLNEEQGVAKCIDRARAALDEAGISAEIVISDSSTDRTPEIAREKGARVVTPDQPGYGYAYRYAFERTHGDYIAIGDADTTYDFAELPRLVDLVAGGDADIAMGSRLRGEIEPDAMPALHQYVGNPLLTKFLNFFYDAGVSDAHSGLRVLSREALDSLEMRTDGMEFASEMIMVAAAEGLTIEEVPITYSTREGEATLESFRDGWRHVKFMLVNAPGTVFTVPALALVALGGLLMGLTVFEVPINGVILGVHSMVAASLLVIVGYQLLSLGVFAAIAGNPITRPKDPVTRWILRTVSLERGATTGLLAAGVGGAYVFYQVARWIASGFTELPFMFGDIAALTAIVIGVQTVFYSFFANAVRER